MAIALVLTGSLNLDLIAKGLIWNQLHLLTFQVCAWCSVARAHPFRLTLTSTQVKNQVSVTMHLTKLGLWY